MSDPLDDAIETLDEIEEARKKASTILDKVSWFAECFFEVFCEPAADKNENPNK